MGEGDGGRDQWEGKGEEGEEGGWEIRGVEEKDVDGRVKGGDDGVEGRR